MRNILAIFLSVINMSIFAQENKQSAFTFGYAHQFPIGNLAERYGDNSSIGCFVFTEKKITYFLVFKEIIFLATM